WGDRRCQFRLREGAEAEACVADPGIELLAGPSALSGYTRGSTRTTGKQALSLSRTIEIRVSRMYRGIDFIRNSVHFRLYKSRLLPYARQLHSRWKHSIARAHHNTQQVRKI